MAVKLALQCPADSRALRKRGLQTLLYKTFPGPLDSAYRSAENRSYLLVGTSLVGRIEVSEPGGAYGPR